MLNKKELEETIRGCRRRDRTAQNRLYRAFFAWAFAICQRYAARDEIAKECVQDGFFKVFTKIDHFNGDLPFMSWFKKVMINTCIDRYRSGLHEMETIEYTADHDERVLPEVLINADAEYLLDLVRLLPPACQTTFNLYAVEGYAYHEIAGMLDVSIGSVKSNLAKARFRLKQLLLHHQTENA